MIEYKCCPSLLLNPSYFYLWFVWIVLWMFLLIYLIISETRSNIRPHIWSHFEIFNKAYHTVLQFCMYRYGTALIYVKQASIFHQMYNYNNNNKDSSMPKWKCSITTNTTTTTRREEHKWSTNNKEAENIVGAKFLSTSENCFEF